MRRPKENSVPQHERIMQVRRSTRERATATIGYWMPLDANQVALVGIVLMAVMLSYLVH
jgi:hypothetical protein